LSSGNHELFQILESAYDSKGLHAVHEVLEQNNIHGYKNYLPLFIDGLNSSKGAIRHFCVCLLGKLQQFEDTRIENEYPYLKEYDDDEYESDYWYDRRQREVNRTYNWIWDYINSNGLFESLKSLTNSNFDDPIGYDAVATISNLAHTGYLGNDDCHKFLFSVLKKGGKSVLSMCLNGLTILRFPTNDEEYAREFGDVLMDYLQLSSLNQWYAHPQRRIAHMIFCYSGMVSKYLWSVHHYSEKMIMLIDNIDDLNLKIKYITNFSEGREILDQYVLSELIKNGLNQNKISEELIKNYFKRTTIDYSKYSEEIRTFMIHVLFSWSKEISLIVWKTIHKIDIEYKIFTEHNFSYLDEDLQTKYLELLLQSSSTESNDELIEFYNNGKFRFNEERRFSFGGPLRELEELLDSVKGDERDIVLRFIVNVAKEYSDVWYEKIRDICREYLEKSKKKEAKRALDDSTILWHNTVNYFVWDAML
jgi:hypothetical protein